MCVCVCSLYRELSKIRDHDAFVSQQAEDAHCQLAEALDQTHTNSESVPERTEPNLSSFSANLIFIKLIQFDINQLKLYQHCLSGCSE